MEPGKPLHGLDGRGPSPNGEREADAAGRLLRAEGLDFDVCYTSYLKRAIRTLHRALAQMDREWLPVYKTWKLNERHYGALQGLNKAETAAKFGEEQVRLWRRAFDVRPPALEDGDERLPAGLAAYREVPPEQLPRTESLADTIARAVPYFRAEIAPALSAGKRVLVAAHGNSLRALVMHLEGLSPEAIAGGQPADGRSPRLRAAGGLLRRGPALPRRSRGRAGQDERRGQPGEGAAGPRARPTAAMKHPRQSGTRSAARASPPLREGRDSNTMVRYGRMGRKKNEGE